MANNQTSNACRTNSWLAAIVLGVLGLLLAWRWLDWGFLSSLVVGAVVFFLVGYLLVSMFCSNSQENETAVETPVAPKATPAPAPTSAPTSAPTPAPAPKPAAAEVAKPAAVKAEPEKVEPKAKKKPAAKAAAKPAAKKPAAKAKAAPKTAKTSSKDGKPAALAAARGGNADDLKKIKGVGPGLEKTLNENGIFHYDQIGAWSKADVAYVDEKMLRFKGRATRDEWVKQAKTLAKGGETAFSKKVDKGDVY
jgi:predicted flap endonuclease-1-like 5' DNA nuclease